MVAAPSGATMTTSKLGIGAVGKRASGEQGLDADHVASRRHRQGDLALDRAAAGFRHAHRNLRFQRPAALGQLFELHGERGFAGRVRRRQIRKRLLHGIDLFIGQAELIAGETRPLFRCGDGEFAFEIEIGRRRAIKETPGHTDLGGDFLRNVPARRGQIEFDPVRHIILDQKRGLADGCAFRVGVGAHVPGAGRCRTGKRQSQTVTAKSLIGDQRAAEFDAIGTLDHEGERHVRCGGALRRAQQRRQIGGLAGTVDAALGIDERIQAGGRRPPADAAVGQIECRPFQVQEGIVAMSVGCRQQRGRRAALAARKPRFELHMTARVGAARRQHLVAAREEPHLGAVLGFRARQRIDENVDAVIAGKRGEAEIGDDEPLRRLRIEAVDAFQLLRLRHHHVNAGLELADRLIDRKGGGDVGIDRRRFDGELALPHGDAARVAQLLDVVAA